MAYKYLGDPFEGFGEFAKKEYGSVTGADLSHLAIQNSGRKPAGLQGLHGDSDDQASSLALKGAGAKPAGLQGYENYDPRSDFETGHMKILGPTPSTERMSAQDLSRFAVKSNAVGGPKSVFGGLGDDQDAFAGLDETSWQDTAQGASGVAKRSLNLGETSWQDTAQGASGVAKRSLNLGDTSWQESAQGASGVAKRTLNLGDTSWQESAQGASGVAKRTLNLGETSWQESARAATNLAKKSLNLGETSWQESSQKASKLAQGAAGVPPAGDAILPEGDWNSNFNAAAQSLTETDLTKALARAVKSVPDNTPDSVKKQYFQLAKQLVEKKRQTSLPALDPQYVELQANLGWLIDSRVPKTGGYGRAVSDAITKATLPLAQKEKDHFANLKLMADGKKLKSAVKKMGKFAGLDGIGSLVTAVVLLGGSAAVAYFAWKHFSKKPVSSKRHRRAK